MANSRLTLLLLVLLHMPACGLLSREQKLPSMEEVRQARKLEQQDWSRLEEAFRLTQQKQQGLAGIRSMVADYPNHVRLAIFLQDMELRDTDFDLVLAHAEDVFRKEPSAIHALLSARVQKNPEERYRLLGLALDLEPSLTQARVYRISMEARAGEPEVLDDLIALLRKDPASAEGWRLLGTLAPLYGRLDLVRAAAETEPWSPVETGTRAAYTLALADLHSGNPRAALAQARQLPPEMWQGRLLEASALARLDNPAKALELVEALLLKYPEEPALWFNKALLLRDYLSRSREARPVLERFLELSKASGAQNVMRVTQAQLWLSLEENP